MSWDDGKHAKVKRVQLTFDDVIKSIQVEYDGSSVKSQPRGAVGSKSDSFILSPDEYITEVTGYYRTVFSGDIITALTFKTNKKTYGPYGNKTSSYFSLNAPKGNQIAGFKGSSSNALNSIDAHFAPALPPGSTGGTGSNTGGAGYNTGDAGSNIGGGGSNTGGGGSNTGGSGSNTGGAGSNIGGDGSNTGGSGSNTGGGSSNTGGGGSNTGGAGSNIGGDGSNTGGGGSNTGGSGSNTGGGSSNTGGASPNTGGAGSNIGGGGSNTGGGGSNTGGGGSNTGGAGSNTEGAGPNTGGAGSNIGGGGSNTGGGGSNTGGAGSNTGGVGSNIGGGGSNTGGGGSNTGGGGSNTGGAGSNTGGAGSNTGGADSNTGGAGSNIGGGGSNTGGDGSNTEGAGSNTGGAGSNTGGNTGSNPQKLEAQGGQGGSQWDDGADHDGVTKIFIAASGQGIEQIKFDYVKNEQAKEGPVHGVKGGRTQILTMEINHPDEYLVSVEGWYDSSNTIQGIKFQTNKTTSQYFGWEFSGDGTQFSLQVKDKKIIGFHGFADSKLNSLGAYFVPTTTSTTPLTPSTSKKLEAKGGDGGDSWDDGVFDGVKKISVGQGNDGVVFVASEYNKGSQVIIGEGHGKQTLLGTETFELDYPSEYITSVEGYYDKILGAKAEIVTCLTFKTNKRTSQPFGMTAGEHFELKEEGYKIVGFHGKAGDLLHQIGVYVVPITTN